MKNLILYPEDFAKQKDWENVCDSLNIPYDSLSVEIIYDRVYPEQKETNRLYCTICESAYLETTEKLDAHSFYCCNVCRDFEQQNDVEIRENNFDDNLVIDSCN